MYDELSVPYEEYSFDFSIPYYLLRSPSFFHFTNLVCVFSFGDLVEWVAVMTE